MKQLVSMIGTRWDVMRWLRLGVGAAVTFEAIRNGDHFLAILGAVFMLQAVFNVGCCGTSTCTPSSVKKMEKNDVNDEVTYTEVK